MLSLFSNLNIYIYFFLIKIKFSLSDSSIVKVFLGFLSVKLNFAYQFRKIERGGWL